MKNNLSKVNEHKQTLFSIDTGVENNLLSHDEIWYGDAEVFDICDRLADNGQKHIVTDF